MSPPRWESPGPAQANGSTAGDATARSASTIGPRPHTPAPMQHHPTSSDGSRRGEGTTSGPPSGSPASYAPLASAFTRRTVSRHLARLGLGRRRFIDPNGENNRQPGKIIARWPGHMAHLDVEKVGRIPNGGRLPCTGQGLVRRPRDQPHPQCRHRQRRLLPIRRLRTDHRQPDSAPEDKALHPSAQRQSRALPTHPGRRTTTGHTALPAASRQPRGFAKASPTSSPPTPSCMRP